MMTKQTISFFNIGLLPVLLVTFYMMLPTEVQAKKLFSNAEFSGTVKKKVPVGEGTLCLKYHFSNLASDFDLKITGLFSNDTIYRGSFMGIEGTFRYELEKSKDAYWVGNDKREHYPILTISVIDGTIDGYYNNRSYDVKVINTQDITISYNENRHSRQYGRDWQISLPALIGKACTENGDSLYFEIKKSYKHYLELEAKWIKTVTPEYEIENNGNEEYEYSFTNGDRATLDKYGKKNFKIHLKDGATISFNINTKDFTINYPNKEVYNGGFENIGYSFLEKKSIHDIRSYLNSLNSEEFKYSNGTLEKSNGERIKYINGKSEQQIEEERQAEERKRQREYQEQERKEKVAAAAKHRDLARKYGERAAIAIENDEPYIGMSEAAFNEIDASYYVYEQTATGTVYAYKTHFVGNHYVQPGRIVQYIVCEHGKIVKIVNL